MRKPPSVSLEDLYRQYAHLLVEWERHRRSDAAPGSPFQINVRTDGQINPAWLAVRFFDPIFYWSPNNYSEDVGCLADDVTDPETIPFEQFNASVNQICKMIAEESKRSDKPLLWGAGKKRLPDSARRYARISRRLADEYPELEKVFDAADLPPDSSETGADARASEPKKAEYPLFTPKTLTTGFTPDGNYSLTATVSGGMRKKTVIWKRIRGGLPKQALLVQILAQKWPDPATIADLITGIYPDAKSIIRDTHRDPKKDVPKVFEKVRSLVNMTRNKIEDNGINPDVLPPLLTGLKLTTTLQFIVGHVNNGEIRSYAAPLRDDKDRKTPTDEDE